VSEHLTMFLLSSEGFTMYWMIQD